MLYIDPNTCIDCGSCAAACPIDAVFPEDDVPADFLASTAVNAAYFQDRQTPPTRPVLRESPRAAGEAQRLRIAIVGAGAAGFYAAEELLSRRDVRVSVDMFDRLPTPFGLVRGGVAPDHQKTKAVAESFERTADHPDFRFHLGVEIGRDVDHEDLAARYHAVLYTVGALNDRPLGIPGEDLAHSRSACEFVAWYNGHPDYSDRQFNLSGTRAVVIGNGNVAIDVARILVSDPDELAKTDIADVALSRLRDSNIAEVVLVGRRGAAQAAFSSAELYALGELPDVDVVVDSADVDDQEVSADLNVSRKLDLLRAFAGQTRRHRKRVVLTFRAAPVEFYPRGIRLRHNELHKDPSGRVTAEPTDHTSDLDTQLVFRSIGYCGTAIPGVPFDQERGIIPNVDGRATGVGDATYVAGWIKRGASGSIGTNRQCAKETVASILDDHRAGRLNAPTCEQSLPIETIGLEGWRRIDDHERSIGAKLGRPRRKLTNVADMMAVASTTGQVVATEPFRVRK